MLSIRRSVAKTMLTHGKPAILTQEASFIKSEPSIKKVIAEFEKIKIM
jgi:hypothetical protein